MSCAIAVVGMACRYPDARDPQELWENALAQRRAFRALPPERLSLADYAGATDGVTAGEAAVLEGWEFDRVAFRVAGSTFRSVDLAHWLALEVADRALQDAGLPQAEGAPRETTGVLVGNTLTGEFSRAALMRLRWPYVRRVVEARLQHEGFDPPRRAAFLQELERSYKAPFPEVDEDTLAGGLSNTIAGRICNHFHLGGGGYTLDGACCSSLLAVARACSALEAGDLDLALAGGVDLSLDPFELVGFSRVGALARGEMRVYDRGSTGFLPGEGCGFVVLARLEDARARGQRVYAVIRGWGLSSDGGGGITRPEVRGQTLALERAYRRAGYGPESVALFEGHGTGTAVGDEVELGALSSVLRAAGATGPPAVVGSIKANIGHTKAAAGAAGLIKAVLALGAQVLPPLPGLNRPRPELDGPALRALRTAEPWPKERPLRAGVSSFGFGGINVHLTLEGAHPTRRAGLSRREQTLTASAQDCELLLLSADDVSTLQESLERVAGVAARVSYAELGDLAAALAADLHPRRVRAAVLASSPSQAAERLRTLAQRLRTPGAGSELVEGAQGLFCSARPTPPRVLFLFPGQGSPVRLDGGAMARRFWSARELYDSWTPPAVTDPESTALAQPAVVAAELAGLRWLESLGVEASLALGHSLGELSALHWAGAFEATTLLELAHERGRIMAAVAGPRGGMASVAADAERTRALLAGLDGVELACFNSPRQTVVSGPRAALRAVAERGRAQGLAVHELPTGHAFHSALMAPTVREFSRCLQAHAWRPLERRVLSTVSAACLARDADLPALLCRQLTAPVLFSGALSLALPEVDLCLEVGPGHVLTRLVNEVSDVPALALDSAGPSLAGLLGAAAAAFVLGAPLRLQALFEDRFTRPFDPARAPRFLGNPCELAPRSTAAGAPPPAPPQELDTPPTVGTSAGLAETAAGAPPIEVVRTLVAARAELPLQAVRDDTRLLRDLHLNSIAVGELVAAASRRLGLRPPSAPLEFADASVEEVGRALTHLLATGESAPLDAEGVPAGVADWTRAFVLAWHERPLPAASGTVAPGTWRVWPAAPAGPLAGLAEASRRWPGSGVVVALPALPQQHEREWLLEAAQALLAWPPGERRFVLLQERASAAAFVRTLHLEEPDVTTCVVEAPWDAKLAARVENELRAAHGHTEVRYDDQGRRGEPCLRLLPSAAGPGDLPLGPGEVALVSGGGKGIVFACARELARATGAFLVLLGRSRPENDAELRANLGQLEAEGLAFRYWALDVTDANAVRATLATIDAEHGPVAALLHGAGFNHPALLRNLDAAALERTLAPKVGGLEHLLAALGPTPLRLLVTFGSVIGRAGLRGQADYALANGLLRELTEDYRHRHPACRCLALESSVWSGVGMGERLGRVEALRREGITPIAPAAGVAAFLRLLQTPAPPTALLLMGRLGVPAPYAHEAPPLPVLRFIEQPRVHYPGVELVADAALSPGSDPYLLDHVFAGETLFLAVLGLEAMQQAAMALVGPPAGVPVFEDLRFDRPVVVGSRESVTLRVAALVREDGAVDVVLRSSQTAFQVDHFSGRVRWAAGLGPHEGVPTGAPLLELDPATELYGKLLFHAGRFRRVAGYRELRASASQAEIAPAAARPWFGPYLPGTLLLGDAAARDAALHSIQACVPHGTLLPVGVERLTAGVLDAGEPLVAVAHARWRSGDDYCYDLALHGRDGELRERWEGLRLRRVAAHDPAPWSLPLLTPYLEWRLAELLGGAAPRLALERSGESRRGAGSDDIIRRALGRALPVGRRADGKPMVTGDLDVSAAHADGLTLALAAAAPAACDLEFVAPRPPQVWHDLLGPSAWRLAEVTAARAGEPSDVAATRVWAALECLKKGAAASAPLQLGSCTPDGWVVFEAGGRSVATCSLRLREREAPLVVAALAGPTGKGGACASSSTVTVSDSKTPT